MPIHKASIDQVLVLTHITSTRTCTRTCKSGTRPSPVVGPDDSRCYRMWATLVHLWRGAWWPQATIKSLIYVAPNSKIEIFPVSSCSHLCPIHWSQLLSWKWSCSWSSANRRCSNYIWMINNFIANSGAPYIRGLTVYIISNPFQFHCFSNCYLHLCSFNSHFFYSLASIFLYVRWSDLPVVYTCTGYVRLWVNKSENESLVCNENETNQNKRVSIFCGQFFNIYNTRLYLSGT